MIDKKERTGLGQQDDHLELKPPVDKADEATVLDPEINLRDRSTEEDEEG